MTFTLTISDFWYGVLCGVTITSGLSVMAWAIREIRREWRHYQIRKEVEW